MDERKKYSIFQQALLDVVLIEYKGIPSEEELLDSFTPEFKQWAAKCIRWSKTRRFNVLSVMKKILIVAIIMALLAGTAMAFPVVREMVIDFFFSAHDDRIGITFDSEQAVTAPKEIKTVYHIGYSPTGYMTILEDITSSVVNYLWVNEEGSCISFSQWPMPENPEDDSWLGLDTESHRETVLMGDYLVEIVHNSENLQFIWTNNAYFFVLEAPADLEQEEINKMFSSFGVIE